MIRWIEEFRAGAAAARKELGLPAETDGARAKTSGPANEQDIEELRRLFQEVEPFIEQLQAQNAELEAALGQSGAQVAELEAALEELGALGVKLEAELGQLQDRNVALEARRETADLLAEVLLLPGVKQMLWKVFHPDSHRRGVDENKLRLLTDCMQKINSAYDLIERDAKNRGPGA